MVVLIGRVVVIMECMIAQRNIINKRMLSAVFIAVVIIVGVLGILIIIDNIPRTYHYEARLPDTRDTRFSITGIDDANITVSFVDEPGLWYRIDVTHYTSMNRHSVENVTSPDYFPLRVSLTSITPIRNINIVLGTDVAHSLYIQGSNLNARVNVDRGAKLSNSRCRFYGSGVFQFFMSEDVNFTSGGMHIAVGDFFTNWAQPELVILDIDLPAGMNGHLSSPNASFIHNDWPAHYDDQWGTYSINEPLLDIKIYNSLEVWASLRV